MLSFKKTQALVNKYKKMYLVFRIWGILKRSSLFSEKVDAFENQLSI